MIRKNFPFLFCLLLVLIFAGCNGESDATSSGTETEQTDESSMPQKNKMVVYQMMTRLFGNKTTLNKKYGTRDENGVGKFSDIDEAALNYLSEMGMTHVWYTGVLEHATMTDYTEFGISLDDADVVKGRAGSPYAIKDYYDINPDLATDVPNRMAEFEAMIERTHKAGLRVVIDFVPNHVARSYASDAKPEGVKDIGENDDNTVSFDVKNNFYYLPGEPFRVPEEYNPLEEERAPGEDQAFEENPAKVTGNDVFSASPKNWDWFETCKLNYGVDIQNDRTTYFDPAPDTWHKMKDILVFWANKGVDGFRCDMAEMVPVEFWGWAIPKVKDVNPEIVFIAEIYNPAEYHNYVQKGKFDYLYDKVGLYDATRRLMGSEGSSEDLGGALQQFEGIEDTRWVFLENHDEQRIGSEEFKGSVETGLAAFSMCAALGKGPAMIYFGQEVGEPGAGEEGFQGADGRTTIFDYWGVPRHQANMNGGSFDGGQLTEEEKALKSGYKKILNLINDNEILATGETHLLPSLGDKAIGYIRHTETQQVLAVTWFGEGPGSVKVNFADLPIAIEGEVKTEVLFDAVDRVEAIDVMKDDGIQIQFTEGAAFVLIAI